MGRGAPAELKAIIRDFRRDQVVEVAARLFGERGTTELSMDDIASEAGVARSTLYVYFANRDELLRACLQRMHTLLLEAVVGPWERGGDPPERLRALVVAMLERIDDNPAFFRLALATQGGPSPAAPTVGAELDVIGLDIAGLIRDVVEEGTRAGVFRLPDPDKATTFVGQQLYGAMSVRAAETDPAPLEEAADDLCGFLLHGLAGPPAAPTRSTGGGRGRDNGAHGGSA
ncbi:MAG TPA: TetR/AcrR family transcriptional regulator [Acidimicrobiales bacterium]|nr:TetR/AcrR family transcriptional regulator [Acidimicrobiales bacterium]